MPPDLTPALARCRCKLGGVFHTDRELLRIFLAEFIGTAVLVIIGDGAVAQWVLSRGVFGTFLSVNFAYALAIAFGVYICGGVSGGHINPSVSVAFAILGKIKWKQLPVYMIAQHLGAFFGAAVVFVVYYDAIVAFDPGERTASTVGIFGTYPNPSVRNGFCLLDQILGTALLVGLVLAICDPRNMAVPKHLIPLLVGLVVGAIGMSFGMNCGYAINPARDLGPRVFTAIAGWKALPFVHGHYFFWVPILGPYIGAIAGAVGYLLFVGNHWPCEHVVVVTQEKNVESCCEKPKEAPAK
jgi:MIP family channel proteins